MLKPMDIHNKEFKKSMRGYDADEVDAFLDEIIVDYEKMQREIDALRNQLSNYSDNTAGIKEKEASLSNVLISAQAFADQLKKEAEDKAAMIIAKAEAEAKQIIGTTEAKYNKVLNDYTTLATRYNDAKETLKDYFQNQIKLLEQEESGVSTSKVAEYILDGEAEAQPVEEAPVVDAMTENEETKINVKLKEMMEETAAQAE